MDASKMTGEKRMNFYDLTPAELESIFKRKAYENYRLKQIFNWVYGRDVINAEKMKNLPQSIRDEITEIFTFEIPKIVKVMNSSDGSSKYIFKALDETAFESVLIPDGKKLTLCISTQAGCRMNCSFCYTGKQGLKRNLATSEIVSQYILVRRIAEQQITNIVFMGMGEPFDNIMNLKKAIDILTSPYTLSFSPRRITVSTCGLIDEMKNFCQWAPRVNIAISLNSPFDETRSKLMPINKRYSLKELITACKSINLPNRRRITFEYIMLKGINDRKEDIRELKKILRNIKCKVNLIKFNSYPGCKYSPSSDEDMKEFADLLRTSGITVMIRKSRGKDIMAACGQLGKAVSF